MEKKIKVHTQYGTLVAEPSGDPDYPGIWISLVKPRDEGNDGEYEVNLVLVESAQDPDNKSELRVLVWSDPNREDYTHNIEAAFAKNNETMVS